MLGKVKSLVLRTGRNAFRNYVTRTSSNDHLPTVSTDARPPIKVSLLGTCQFELLVKASHGSEHRVRHLLMGSQPFAQIPELADDDDAGIIGISLRQVISRASGLTVPASDMVFARLGSAQEAQVLLDSCETVLNEIIRRFEERRETRPLIFVSFFEPSANYMGDLIDRYAPESALEFVKSLNRILAQLISPHANFHFLDMNELLNHVGRRYLQDDGVLHGSHASFVNDWDFKLDSKRLSAPQRLFAALEFERAIKDLANLFLDKVSSMLAILRQEAPVKLTVCDLDDTLWRGVPAEDDDFSDDDRVEGWPLGLVEALLFFKARGGVLALCSKNEMETVKANFERIFRGALTLDDFAVVRANWTPKSQNIAEILTATNLLARNCLFIDDNPREISEVKAAHPDIRCLGSDHYNWRRIVLGAPETQVATITTESTQRTELVRAAAGRAVVAATVATSTEDRAGWLASLELKQAVELVTNAKSPHYKRAFELLNKTNQFNTTGRRWSAGEFDSFLRDGGNCIVSGLKDNSIDNGITSVCMLKGNSIEQIVLSCRVFGLGSEITVCAAALDLILAAHATASARIVDTGRNATCHGFFTSVGFDTEGDHFVISHQIDVPDYIAVTRGAGLEKAARKTLEPAA